MKKAVFCIVENEQQTQRIIDRLLSSNFNNEDISVLFANKGKLSRTEPSSFGEVDVSVRRRPERSTLAHEKSTKAPEGAASGAIAGGVIGGTIGLLAGIGAIAIPGLGPFIAAGPLMAALSGSALGGTAGLLIGALTGLGIPEYEAKLYEGKLREGNILIAVHCETNEEANEVKRILDEEGAKDISVTMEKSARR